MSEDDIAQESGISKSGVHKALRGTGAISLEAYVAICQCLDIKAEELLAWAMQQAPPETGQPRHKL